MNSQSITRSQFKKKFVWVNNVSIYQYALHIMCDASTKGAGNTGITVTRLSEITHVSLYLRSKVSILEDVV